MSKEFTDNYIDQVFYSWYENDKKLGKEFILTLPDDGDNKKPTKDTIVKWVSSYGWMERADALDAEASRAIDATMIERRRKMYEEQVRVANELVKQGMEFLNEKGITSDTSAIRAIDLGLTTQRVSTGVAEAYVKISKMSDEQLNKELQKLMGVNPDPNVIDADVVDE